MTIYLAWIARKLLLESVKRIIFPSSHFPDRDKQKQYQPMPRRQFHSHFTSNCESCLSASRNSLDIPQMIVNGGTGRKYVETYVIIWIISGRYRIEVELLSALAWVRKSQARFLIFPNHCAFCWPRRVFQQERRHFRHRKSSFGVQLRTRHFEASAFIHHRDIIETTLAETSKVLWSCCAQQLSATTSYSAKRSAPSSASLHICSKLNG